MKYEQGELQKELAEVRAQIREADSHKIQLLNKESSLKRELEATVAPMLSATNLWCKITNALIAKYKNMSEENPNEAVKQLLMIQDSLLAGGFLTQKDLDEAL